MSETDRRPVFDERPPSRGQFIAIVLLYLGLFLLAGLAVNGVYTDRSQNQAQAAANKARDEQGALVSKCLNDFGLDKATVDKAVRVASQRVSKASNTEARASLTWTTALAEVAKYTGEVTPSPAAQSAVARFVRANAALREAQIGSIRAQENLDKVRRQNPIPVPTCDLESLNKDE